MALLATRTKTGTTSSVRVSRLHSSGRFNGVRRASLEHIRLQTQTLLKREERKKTNKKEKKD